jgi:hypothetical protein
MFTLNEYMLLLGFYPFQKFIYIDYYVLLTASPITVEE